jgi:hypothetical protein
LRDGTTTYAEHYTAEQKETFVRYMGWMDDYPQLDREMLQDIFLGIYANPIDNSTHSVAEHDE